MGEDRRMTSLGDKAPPKLGMSIEEARQQLSNLRPQRDTIIKKIDELGIDLARLHPSTDLERPTTDNERLFVEWTDRLRLLDVRVTDIREWYGIGVLESIDTYSKKLHTWTKVVAILTGILALMTLVHILRTFMLG